MDKTYHYICLNAISPVGLSRFTERYEETSKLDEADIVLVRSAGAQLHADARSVLIILMLGVVHTGFAYCLYFSGMSTLPVQTVAILGYLEPVVSVLCSVAFLHEPLTPAGWVGAVLVLGAAVLSEL